MKTKTIYTYQFHELDESAKEKARAWYRQGQADAWPAWQGEWVDSLKQFADHYPITIKNYNVSVCGYSFVNFEVDAYRPDRIDEMQGVRLWKYLQAHYPIDLSGSCPFTGYCGDEDLLDPIRAFMTKPDPAKTFHELMDECLQSWVKGFVGDIEYQNSDEYIDEQLDANECDFDKLGNVA